MKAISSWALGKWAHLYIHSRDNHSFVKLVDASIKDLFMLLPLIDLTS